MGAAQHIFAASRPVALVALVLSCRLVDGYGPYSWQPYEIKKTAQEASPHKAVAACGAPGELAANHVIVSGGSTIQTWTSARSPHHVIATSLSHPPGSRVRRQRL